MSADVLYCKELAQKIKDEVKAEVDSFRTTIGRVPTLVTFIVGDDPASKVYVRNKLRAAEYTGINGRLVQLDASITKEALLEKISYYSEDADTTGILVQLPLPGHISEEEVIEYLPYYKDVDGFHPVNLGKLMRGCPFLEPCTPAGIIEIFKYFNIDPSGKNVVVIGRSNIVGKPIANMLIQKSEWANATVTIVHTATKDIGFFTKNADIVIVSAGRPGVLTADMVKEDAVIIDVGINKVPANNEKGYRLMGDADFETLVGKVRAITPVPGGVGLMTVAMLMRNVVRAFKFQNKIGGQGNGL